MSTSTEGRAFADFIRDIRRLCQQCAALLKAADEFLARDGWENAMKLNIAHAESSASILVPERWLPQEFARLYKNQAYPHNVIFVALLLDDDKFGDYQLEEPLATAGWVELSEALETTTYWWCRLHGYRPNRRNDGSVQSLEAKDLTWSNKANFVRASTLGLPLVSLKSIEALREQLLQPLTVGFAKCAPTATRDAP